MNPTHKGFLEVIQEGSVERTRYPADFNSSSRRWAPKWFTGSERILSHNFVYLLSVESLQQMHRLRHVIGFPTFQAE